MALPENPICGDYTLTNSAGIDDLWTCPNCYENHEGSLQDETIECKCGAHLRLTIKYEPVCHAECIDPDEEDD